MAATRPRRRHPKSTATFAAFTCGSLLVPTTAAAGRMDPGLPVTSIAASGETRDERISELESTNSRLRQRLKEVEDLLFSAREAGFSPTTPKPVPMHRVGATKIPEFVYEELIMLVVVLFMVAVCFLPFTRCCKKRCETRIHKVFPAIIVINWLLLALTLDRLYMIDFNSCFFATVRVFEVVVTSSKQFLVGLAALVAVFVAWRLKDRVFETLGVENGSQIIGDFRDWATCWSMRRFHAVELYVWKVEGLPTAKMTSNNHLFAEVTLGYNKNLRTRVHPNAGTACILKESVQFNFDPFDTDSRLHLSFKSQGPITSEDLAHLQLGTPQVQRLEEKPPISELDPKSTLATLRHDQSLWDPVKFVAFDLIPAGTVYLRCVEVAQEDESTSCKDLCCCCLD